MIAALIGLGVGLLSAGASQGDASRIFRGAKDAVVTIGTPTGAGTGFITGDGTLLVTAAHIVEGENLSEIQTSLKDLRVVSVHAFDPDRDVAVLKLNKPASRRLALASALPQPGTEIFVIGTPLGFLQQTISEGIVSGIRKTGTGTLLQITAPVSPGSSGSPVLNSAGQVVGMVVGGIQEGQLLNFAVASSEIQRVIASARKPYEDPTATPPPKPEVSRAERIADLVSKLSGSWGDEAARKLADLGAIGALSECAKSSSGAVRKRAIDGLVRALSDSFWLVRSQAANALGEIKDPRAVEPLIRALSDSDSIVRSGAAEALGEIEDKRALGALQRLLGDDDEYVRKAAREAIRKIEGRPPLADNPTSLSFCAESASGTTPVVAAEEPLTARVCRGEV